MVAQYSGYGTDADGSIQSTNTSVPLSKGESPTYAVAKHGVSVRYLIRPLGSDLTNQSGADQSLQCDLAWGRLIPAVPYIISLTSETRPA